MGPGRGSVGRGRGPDLSGTAHIERGGRENVPPDRAIGLGELPEPSVEEIAGLDGEGFLPEIVTAKEFEPERLTAKGLAEHRARVERRRRQGS